MFCTSATVGFLTSGGRCSVCGGGSANSDCDERRGTGITSGCMPSADAERAKKGSLLLLLLLLVCCLEVDGRERSSGGAPRAARRKVGSEVDGREDDAPPSDGIDADAPNRDLGEKYERKMADRKDLPE